jgi:hypothetical protein
MSHDALIDGLSAGLAPVRRRSVARETIILFALGAAQLALFLGIGLMRPDMGQAIDAPFMWWKLGSLALLVAISVTTAIRSLSPTVSPRRGLTLTFAVAAVALMVGMLAEPGFTSQAGLAERIEPLHGMGCALAIIILSLPMAGLMGMLMRRGAPVNPKGSALAIGLAAGSWGAFVFAFCCPANDPFYVAVWYALGCTVVAAAARWLLPRGFRL